MSKAHNLEEKERTKDVLIDEPLNFNALLLSEPTLTGLQKSGFQKPSPIQLKAIPIGKCGFDLIVKSKSGTGKTLVFGLIALEAISLSKKQVQALVLAPTREIAVQIQTVIRDIGSEYKGLNVECFIGGLPIDEDLKKAEKCHIAVGAPGRVRHLIHKGILNIKQVKLFVIDEVDKIVTQNSRVDLDEIVSKLPPWKQTIALSATMSKETEDYLEQYMSSPTLVEPTTDSPLLLGIRQFVDIVKTNLNIVHQLDIKNKELIRLLSQISFTQCLVFTNYQTRAASICNHLNRYGWNSLYISADQKQTERLQVIEALKNGKCKILLSTDLTARGIDASNVDLTINYDVPYEASTYLHRMGRAGRYGTKGLCITIATEDELTSLKKLLGSIAGANFLIARLPKHGDLPSDLINLDSKALQFEQSVVDLVNIPQECKNILSSIVDIKTSKIPKPSSKYSNRNQDFPKIKEETFSDSKQSFDTCFLSSPVSAIQSSDLKDTSNFAFDSNARCFSQATITPSDTTLDRTETLDNLENPELKSLLTMLEDRSENTLNISNTTELSSESTNKRKRNGKSHTNVQEALCNKNVTLLHVAELLTSPHIAEVPNESKSAISQFVDTLRTDDSMETTKEDQEKRNNEVPESQQNPEELNIDNIFKLSYDYAVKPSAPNWVETLGIHLEEKVVLNEVMDEPNEEKPTYFPKKRYRSSKYRRNVESKYDKLHQSSNNSSGSKQTKNIHLNASFTEDSYSNTPTDSASNHTGKSASNHQVADFSRQDFKRPTQNQFQTFDKRFIPEQCDHDYIGNQHFIDCFQKYSDELTEKLQTFEDMESFQSWYQQWQWQVQKVREYVQQNIYIQEMNTFMYGGK